MPIRPMTEEFARWYLWARTLHEKYLDDLNARLLVQQLRQLDDLGRQRDGDGDNTPVNLLDPILANIEMLAAKVVQTYPHEPPLG